MAQNRQPSQLCTFRKNTNLILAFIWVLGLMFGALIFHFAGAPMDSLMRRAVSGSVSIVSLLMCTFFPFLFSAMAVYLSLPFLLLGVCFSKAFSFAFVSCAVFSAFGSCSWLVRSLLLFSDLLSTVTLYLFWSVFLSGKRSLSSQRLIGYSAIFLLIVFSDYHFIIPLLQGIAL